MGLSAIVLTTLSYINRFRCSVVKAQNSEMLRYQACTNATKSLRIDSFFAFRANAAGVVPL